MIYKGTDRDAFEKASKGLTKKSRSRKYKKIKAQNERRREQEAKSSSLPSVPRSLMMPKPPIRVNQSIVSRTQYMPQKKYVEKKTILDDVRDYRSSKIVSNVSNSLATFIVRCGGRQWDNSTKNLVRSAIALAVSEVTNKVFENPLKIVENIKLFIKVGKIVYKIVVWIDKITSLWTTNDKFVSSVPENDFEYVSYIRQYPRLVGSIPTTNVEENDMKYNVGDIVVLNSGLAVHIITVNDDDKTYCAISMGADKIEYTISDDDICELIGHADN